MKPIVFLAAAAALIAAPAVASGKRPREAYDPSRIVCKIEPDPVSRFARRKVCRTMSEWDETKRIERLYLMQNQRNGAP